MAEFGPAVTKTLKIEGGYSNNPNDAGGPTNFGITLGLLMSLGKHGGDLNHDGSVNIEDVKFMTQQDALNIYKQLYWHGDNITSQAIAEKNFDMGVNIGVSNAAKLLQKALNQLGQLVEIDGNIGPATITNVNMVDENALMTELCTLQEDYYWSITQSNIEKKALAVYTWPQQLFLDAIAAVQARNLSLVKIVVAQLYKLKLTQGNISFIGGWVTRAKDRFGL
ncbi:MAG: hypothetical protein JHC33_10840 [Ignisphaera sp.]|nr:hypothetical protein [Ignisphaera sp.]